VRECDGRGNDRIAPLTEICVLCQQGIGGAVMNWADFFAMNGYGFYVWGSYGLALLVFIIEIVLVRHKRSITLKQLRLMRDAGGEQ
jgi:heme exporter protein D